jgi:Holliday junction resolvase-like predicted endonuclease
LRIADLKRKGGVAELMVAADLRRRGHRILFPYGEGCDHDLVAERPDGRLDRVQVKYTESDGTVVEVRCRSHSLTNGRVRAVKRYTHASVDWLAVYDETNAALLLRARLRAWGGPSPPPPAPGRRAQQPALTNPPRGGLPILLTRSGAWC